MARARPANPDRRPSAAGTGVSVVVCTYNGARRLPACLEALAACASDGPVELVVVDNNSIDGSGEIAAHLWTSLGQPWPLIVVREPRQGLAYARQRGVATSRHELIVFCDDDNLLAPDYLDQTRRLMADPREGAISGVSTPVSEVELPSWFYAYAECYAVGQQVRTPEGLEAELVDLTPDLSRCPWGAGLAARRTDLLKVFAAPAYPLLSGRDGQQLTSGDDYEICHLIALMGRRLLCSSRLQLRHVIPPQRLTADYLRGLIAGFRTQGEALDAYVLVREALAPGPARRVLRTLAVIARNTLRLRGSGRELFVLCAMAGLTGFMSGPRLAAYRNARHVGG